MPSGYPAKSKRARRSPALAARICELVPNMTLRQVAREIGWQSHSSITVWLREDEQFAAQYARAMELRVDRFAEEIIEISDDATNDWIEREIADGVFIQVPNHEHITRSKLRVDARKWLMAKMAPKKYGDRLVVETKDGSDPAALSDEQLESERRSLEDQRQAVADRKRELGERVPGGPLKLVSGGTKAA